VFFNQKLQVEFSEAKLLTRKNIMKIKELLVILLVSLVPFGCSFLGLLISPYTNEQCEVVEQNFDKLKVGMTKQEVIPLIGGERNYSVTYPPGNFPWKERGEYEPHQKNPWQLWVLCHNPKNRGEWLMIAFDTKTNRVVRIFSGDPELYDFV
jgi:hypothetical protein